MMMHKKQGNLTMFGITARQMGCGLAVVLSLSLSACFKTNPPVHTERYHLPEVSQPQAMTQAKQTLILGNIQLADYLDSDRMMIQTDDITMQAARDHLWVDNLSQELRRGLRSRLAYRLPHTVITDPGPVRSASPTLYLTIDQFHGQMQGYAVLRGQWQLMGGDHSPVSSPVSFRFSTALTENGYPALVRALGTNLDLLSDQIAQQLPFDQ